MRGPLRGHLECTRGVGVVLIDEEAVVCRKGWKARTTNRQKPDVDDKMSLVLVR